MSKFVLKENKGNAENAENAAKADVSRGVVSKNVKVVKEVKTEIFMFYENEIENYSDDEITVNVMEKISGFMDSGKKKEIKF